MYVGLNSTLMSGNKILDIQLKMIIILLIDKKRSEQCLF